MFFAGGNQCYISKKKLEKLNQKNKIESKVNNMGMSYVKEEIEDDEKEVDDHSSNVNLDKNLGDTSKVSIKSPRSRSKGRNRSSSRSIEKLRKRSRSNSCEKIKDEELDFQYSDPDDFRSEEDNEELKNECFFEKSPILNYSEKGIMQQETKKGFFSKVGDTFSGLFSKKNKESKSNEKKKCKYQLSYLDKKNEVNSAYEHEVDTNVLTIGFEFLKNKVAFATGDPIRCQCEAVLNFESKIEKIENSDKFLWICEFCCEKNEIFIEKEEIPTGDCIDYIYQSVNQLKGKDYNYNDEQTLIFCFDISGSMCVSSPITGKHKFKGNTMDKNLKDLMAYSDGSDQNYGNDKNVTYISRLQCLQAAIESNLNNLNKMNPNRRVGFVTFNNEVIAYGDGTKTQVKINGNNLNDYDTIKQMAEKSHDIISVPLKDSHNFLMKQLFSIEETGQTALGPAILFSLNLISGVSPGSRIILCTDGISNMGVGSMDQKTSISEIQELKDFYTNMGLFAKEKGIIIDLITFEDEQSNIEVLMNMIDQTGGEIIRVKCDNILQEFSNLLQNDIVATNVKVKVKLHKTMKFRNEDIINIKHEGSTLIKDIGNATKESEMYIEYCFKKSEEIAKYGIEIDKLSKVPFQTLIDYTNSNGDKCLRVVTKTQEISSEKEVIQEKANFNIISVNAMQKSSKLAQEGQFRIAQSNALAWKKMMKNAPSTSNAHNNYKVFNNNMNDFNENLQEHQYMQKCTKTISQQSDKLSQQMHQMKNISQSKSTMEYAKSKKK